ncbi:MAG TPA: hypothetical protein VNK95_24780 [Caldilineaceae bacterium]|nr:hypothetical protein [Caldilineaceae bacterium]
MILPRAGKGKVAQEEKTSNRYRYRYGESEAEESLVMILGKEALMSKSVHPWLRRIGCAYVPGPLTPLLEETVARLLGRFERLGHQVQAHPNQATDLILTTGRLGMPVNWRESLLFSSRRRFGLSHSPVVYTLVHAYQAEFEGLLTHFANVLAKKVPDRADYNFPGLASHAYSLLHAQGQRGGPMLALERLVQAQVKSIRVVLIVGDDTPNAAYHFDLVGAYPQSKADDLEEFYTDIVLRMVTALSTSEVQAHQVIEEPIPRALWDSLTTPEDMRQASQEFGRRNFFSEIARISDLVHVPALSEVMSSQYSEGCFATWDPVLQALIATVTGSARPVDKGNLSEDDLAVIVGIREDGLGALVRHVAGKRNDPPSSEAVEMIEMDRALPMVTLGPEWGEVAGRQAPVIRSKLHGHRSVDAYNAERVEYVPLDVAYYHYPVSCATEAQAKAIKAAFARSQALQNPADPRQVVFTILPGHGVMLAEKWAPGLRPFQLLWESMDAGHLQLTDRVPQGPMWYLPGADGLMVLHSE